MKWLWCIVLFLCALGLSIWMGVGCYRVKRDTTSWLYRAQVSAEPSDMVDYLQKVKEGMKRWGLTEGSANLVFKKPSTDMRLIMKSIDSAISNLKPTIKMDRGSTAYQVALDNQRGILRELELYSFARWNVNVWLVNILIAVSWIATIVMGIVMGIVALNELWEASRNRV